MDRTSSEINLHNMYYWFDHDSVYDILLTLCEDIDAKIIFNAINEIFKNKLIILTCAECGASSTLYHLSSCSKINKDR